MQGGTKRWSRIAIASSGIENPFLRSAHRGRSERSLPRRGKSIPSLPRSGGLNSAVRKDRDGGGAALCAEGPDGEPARRGREGRSSDKAPEAARADGAYRCKSVVALVNRLRGLKRRACRDCVPPCRPGSISRCAVVVSSKSIGRPEPRDAIDSRAWRLVMANLWAASH